MNFERTRWTRLASMIALALALGVLGPIATSRAAEDAAEKAPDAAPAIDPRATEIVQRMAERIVAADRIRVGGEIAWDVVQADGQTLEFGATRELVLQRPDHLRVDIDLREGGERRLLYDGKQIVLEDLAQNVYATVPRDRTGGRRGRTRVGSLRHPGGALGVPLTGPSQAARREPLVRERRRGVHDRRRALRPRRAAQRRSPECSCGSARMIRCRAGSRSPTRTNRAGRSSARASRGGIWRRRSRRRRSHSSRRRAPRGSRSRRAQVAGAQEDSK